MSGFFIDLHARDIRNIGAGIDTAGNTHSSSAGGWLRFPAEGIGCCLDDTPHSLVGQMAKPELDRIDLRSRCHRIHLRLPCENVHVCTRCAPGTDIERMNAPAPTFAAAQGAAE